MSQQKLQQRAARTIAVNGPVAFESRPAGSFARLVAGLLRRLSGRKAGTAEDQARLRERLERQP